jgi:hypothetical protein
MGRIARLPRKERDPHDSDTVEQKVDRPNSDRPRTNVRTLRFTRLAPVAAYVDQTAHTLVSGGPVHTLCSLS